MSQKTAKRASIIFLLLTIATFLLLLFCCIPRSWGYQGVREFFDLVGAVGGNTMGNVGWFHLEIWLILFAVLTDLTHSHAVGKRAFFAFPRGASTANKVLRVIGYAALAMLIGAGFHYLSYFTDFM